MKNKGFTVIELILSFAFVSILSSTLFAAVINYKDKEAKVANTKELREFRDKIVIEIQNDIELKLLKNIEYCPSSYEEHEENGTKSVQRLCLTLNFLDNTSKNLKVLTEQVKSIETISNQTFSFEDRHDYITYGDIRYELPDKQNIYIGNNYMFRSTTLADGIENNIAIYNITIPIKHKTVDGNFDISVTAFGRQRINNEAGSFKSYNAGDIVKVQVNPREQENFYVLAPSSTYSSKVTLITFNNLSTSKYYLDNSSGTSYEGSIVEKYLKYIYDDWVTIDNVRLPYAEEIGFLVNACPMYMIEKEETAINLKDVDEWIYTESSNAGGTENIIPNTYWTQTAVKGGENKVWVVDGINEKMEPKYVSGEYGIRPVVIIDKSYIIGLDSDTYRIDLDGNGANNEIRPLPHVTCTRYNNCILPTNPYVKDGFTFMGWTTDLGSDIVQYTNGQTVYNLAPSGVVTLYAVWKQD